VHKEEHREGQPNERILYAALQEDMSQIGHERGVHRRHPTAQDGRLTPSLWKRGNCWALRGHKFH